MFSSYKYAARNRGRFFRQLRNSGKLFKSRMRGKMSSKAFSNSKHSGVGWVTVVPSSHVPAFDRSVVSYKHGNLRKRAREIDRKDFAYNTGKLAITLGAVGRGIYSLAKNKIKKRYRGYDDPAEYVLPMFDYHEEL